MLATDRVPRKLTGHAKPRIAPPTPARSQVAEFRATAKEMGIVLMPWQETAGRYLTAQRAGGGLLYREVCIVVARQNGKTTLMKPLIVGALRAGKRVMHIAQNRELPRHMFGIIADALTHEPDLFPKRRGRTIWPRYGSGQEEITLLNGGNYRIAAASRGSARGHPIDLLIFDELREMVTWDAVAAAEPTLTMSPDPQEVYLSNAGTEQSVVLNAIRDRAGTDPSLAYLEWSAAPERTQDDPEGWVESNPAYGHFPAVARTLELAHRRHSLAGTMAIFETEHLCRWQESVLPRVVEEADWLLRKGPVGSPIRPSMAVSLGPTGRRASAALAWPLGRDRVALRIEADVTGSPIDTERLGEDLQRRSLKIGASRIGFDDRTDRDLVRSLKRAKAIGGNEFAAASDKFDRLVRSGALVWEGAEAVTTDLRWLARKATDTGAWQAVRVDDDHDVTAALASIRAVWLASEPRPNAPKVL